MMKIAILLGLLFLLSLSTTQAVERHATSEVEEITQKELEIFDGKPNKPYSLISPISADKDSTDKAFEKLKAKAINLHADAIIDMNCQAGEKIRTGMLQIKTIGTAAVCQGLAVKWR